LRAKFPRLVQQYEKWFGRNGYAPEEYRRKVEERVAKIRQTYGFRSRPFVEKKHSTPCSQMSLGWDAAALQQMDQRGFT